MMRLSWVLVLALLVAACSGGEGNGPDATVTTVSPPSSDVEPELMGVDLFASVTERETSPGADGQAVNSVVEGANEFAVRFFKAAVPIPTENVVVGNYSLSTALLLTMAGTGGETTSQFADLLGVGDVDPGDLHSAVNAIDLILQSRVGDELELSIANKLFVQEGIELRDTFLDTAVSSYGAPVTAVDFFEAPADAVDAVNQWVNDATDGSIPVLAAEEYSPQTVLVLANAMYLKASWAVPFHRLDGKFPFTTQSGDVVEVEMMGHDEFLPIHQGPDTVAVELPYVGGNLGLVIVQPSDLAEFESNLTAADLAEISGRLMEGGVHLTTPIWSTESDIEALDLLQGLGLPSHYDFGPLFEDEGNFFIHSVSHVARIDVDETGTTAGAATGVAIAGSHGPTISIDRPFFYFIRDRGSGAILFLGHVTDPR